jgi:hypothetical protein
MTADSRLCDLRWCQENAGHSGPHRIPLYDTDGLNVTTGRPSVLQAWVQAESARIPVVVLVTDSRETGLTWPQVRRLADVLLKAQRTYFS